MSNAIGGIRFKDGTIRYYEYSGSYDMVISAHYATTQEVYDNWRTYPEMACKCGKEEDVELYSSYGGGFYFTGQACKDCGSCRGEAYNSDKGPTTSRSDADDDWFPQVPGRW